MKSNYFKVISAALFLAAVICICFITIPLIKTYNNPDDFSRFINDFGSFGFIVMLFLQISQIIVALIPGEIIEFVAGTLYGCFGGLIFCLTGIAAGESLIFLSVRFFGKTFVEKAAGSKTIQKYKFLHEEKRLKIILFILYFLPGTPKDLLTYFVPLTKISLFDFILVSVIARIPSVLSSTYAGSAFAEKDYTSLIVIYSAIILFSTAGFVIYNFWQTKHKSKDD